MSGQLLTYSAPTSKALTANQTRDLVFSGFSAADRFFNGDSSALAKYVDDMKSPVRRTAIAARCASRAGIFWLSNLLWIAEDRRVAKFNPTLPSPWDFLYRAARCEDDIWKPDCAQLLINGVHALRKAMPNIRMSYDSPMLPAAEKTAPAPVPAPKEKAGDTVQKIEIVGMPQQQVAITRMPPPGTLKVDVASMPGMLQETTFVHHPNTQEILKSETTSRPVKSTRRDDGA